MAARRDAERSAPGSAPDRGSGRSRTRACWMWAAATAPCSRSSRGPSRSTPAASNSARPGCTSASAADLQWFRAMPIRISPIFPDASFDYVILSQTIQAMRNPRQVLREHAAHRPLRHRVVHQLRLLACALAPAAAWPHAERRAACRSRGMPPRTSTRARSRISSSCATQLGLTHPRTACVSPRAAQPSQPVLATSALDNLLSEQALFLLARPGSRSAA